MLNYLLFIIAGVSFGLGCQFPETFWCEGLAFLAIVILAGGSLHGTKRIKTAFYMFGLAFSIVAFYWIPETLQYFGGFNVFIAYILFGFYCLLTSIQFVFCAWLFIVFDKTKLKNCHLSLPLAWLVSEYFWPRLFPWALAHPFVSWPAFSALAEFIGVYPLSALILCWGVVAVGIVERLFKKARIFTSQLIIILGVSVTLLLIGAVSHFRIQHYITNAPKIQVGVVQGNLEAKQKVNIKEFKANIDRYRMLSAEAIKGGAELLIWPEAVIEKWTPEGILSVHGTTFDPAPEISIPFIFGGMTYRLRSKQDITALIKPEMTAIERDRLKALYFNSAIFTDNEKTIVGMYHKRILMPFGEYMPLAKTFPLLKKMSPQTGDFDFGDRISLINMRLQSAGKTYALRVGSLICYEDLVPSLSAEAEREGANLLINLTNDAWYGNTAAPLQHHLLAMWRAIENRSYLIRATNTGFTGIVDPTGRTIASIPLFSSGYLVEPVGLLETQTIFSIVGDWPVLIISLGSLLFGFLPKKEKS